MLIDGIFEALIIQSLRCIVFALVEAVCCLEGDNHTTQVQRALQDRLVEIDFVTGWKLALSGIVLPDRAVGRDAAFPARLIVSSWQPWKCQNLTDGYLQRSP